jgi:hypothetical protein
MGGVFVAEYVQEKDPINLRGRSIVASLGVCLGFALVHRGF